MTDFLTDARDGQCYAIKEAGHMTITVGYLKSYEQARLTDGWYYWIDGVDVPRGRSDSPECLDPFDNEEEAWDEVRNFAGEDE